MFCWRVPLAGILGASEGVPSLDFFETDCLHARFGRLAEVVRFPRLGLIRWRLLYRFLRHLYGMVIVASRSPNRESLQ